MSPRFGEKILGAALMAGLAGTAAHPETAQAGGYSEENQEMTAYANEALKKNFPKYTIEATQSSMSKTPHFEIHIESNDTPWETYARVQPPSDITTEAIGEYLTEEVKKILQEKNAPEREISTQKESLESVVEKMTIIPAAREMILSMGGDPTPYLTVSHGETLVVLKLSNASKDGSIGFDKNTAEVLIEPGYDLDGNEVLQVNLKNEDGTQQLAYWNLDGTFGQ